MASDGNKDFEATLSVYVGRLSAMVCVYACINVYACDCICLCKSVFQCVSVCVGSDQTLAFQSCDGCQSNARGRKCLKRRQTQT